MSSFYAFAQSMENSIHTRQVIPDSQSTYGPGVTVRVRQMSEPVGISSSDDVPQPVEKERCLKRLRTGRNDTFAVDNAINVQINDLQKKQNERDGLVDESIENLRQDWIAGKHISNCCKKKCWSQFSLEAVLYEREMQMASGNHRQRSIYLARCIKLGMAQSPSGFVISGKPVCCVFFRFVHGVSNKKLFKIKSDFLKDSTGGDSDSDSEDEKELGAATCSNPKRKHNAASVVSFINRLAVYGDKYPTNSNIYLYCLSRTEVFNLYKKEIEMTNQTPVVKKYFERLWKRHCSHVKLREMSRFAKCTECTRIRDLMRKNTSLKDNDALLDLKRKHHDVVMAERAAYYAKQQLAIRDPDNYLSLIIDGADQSAYSLPYFVEKSKNLSSKPKMKHKLHGVIAHGIGSWLYAVPMNAGNGCNLTIETLHRVLSDIKNARKGQLPQTLYLQLDNCTGQNKNNYLMAYLSLLVEWGVFKEIEVGYLPVGHTHEDIDQMFSRFAIALETNDAITVSELLRVCQKAYHPTPATEELKYQINFKEKIDRDGALLGYQAYPELTDPLAFRFVKGVDGKVGVLVKRRHSDTMWLDELVWAGVNPREDTKPHCYFISRVTPQAFFQNFPSSIRPAVAFNELSEIRKTVENCPRIDDNTKLQQLRWAIDELAVDQIDAFAWDLILYGIDQNGRQHLNDPDSDTESQDELVNGDEESNLYPGMITLGPQIIVADTGSKYLYTKDSMVLVRPDREQDKTSPFWLARVLHDVPLPEGSREVPEVEIVWYDPARKDRKAYESGKFFECRQKVGKKWILRTDVICSSTVIRSFAKLEKDQIPKWVINSAWRLQMCF